MTGMMAFTLITNKDRRRACGVEDTFPIHACLTYRFVLFNQTGRLFGARTSREVHINVF